MYFFFWFCSDPNKKHVIFLINNIVSNFSDVQFCKCHAVHNQIIQGAEEVESDLGSDQAIKPNEKTA